MQAALSASTALQASALPNPSNRWSKDNQGKTSTTKKWKPTPVFVVELGWSSISISNIS